MFARIGIAERIAEGERPRDAGVGIAGLRAVFTIGKHPQHILHPVQVRRSTAVNGRSDTRVVGMRGIFKGRWIVQYTIYIAAHQRQSRSQALVRIFRTRNDRGCLIFKRDVTPHHLAVVSHRARLVDQFAVQVRTYVERLAVNTCPQRLFRFLILDDHPVVAAFRILIKAAGCDVIRDHHVRHDVRLTVLIQSHIDIILTTDEARIDPALIVLQGLIIFVQVLIATRQVVHEHLVLAKVAAIGYHPFEQNAVAGLRIAHTSHRHRIIQLITQVHHLDVLTKAWRFRELIDQRAFRAARSVIFVQKAYCTAERLELARPAIGRIGIRLRRIDLKLYPHTDDRVTRQEEVRILISTRQQIQVELTVVQRIDKWRQRFFRARHRLLDLNVRRCGHKRAVHDRDHRLGRRIERSTVRFAQVQRHHQAVQRYFCRVFHAQVHDHIEVTADLTGREVHTHDIQVRLDIGFVHPAQVQRLIPLIIGKGRRGRVYVVQLAVFAFHQVIHAHFRILIVRIINRKHNARTRIAVSVIRCIRIIRQRQHAVLRPEVHKARTVRLQVFLRDQVVRAGDQTVEGVQPLSVGLQDLRQVVITTRYFDTDVVQDILYGTGRAHRLVVIAHRIKLAGGRINTSPDQHQVQRIHPVLILVHIVELCQRIVLVAVHIVIVPRQVTDARYRYRIVFHFAARVLHARIYERWRGLVEVIIVGTQVSFPAQAVAHERYPVVEVRDTRIRHRKGQYLYQAVTTG